MSDREGVPPEGGTPDPFHPGEPQAPAEGSVAGAPSVDRELELPMDTGRLQALTTDQLLIIRRPQAEAESEAVQEVADRRLYGWISVVVGSVGAAASLFVGWMLPLSIAAIVFGVLGLRREEAGRSLAYAGIGTGIAGLVFSAVWIGYYAIVFGALPA